jgi:hypothetical protein
MTVGMFLPTAINFPLTATHAITGKAITSEWSNGFILEEIRGRFS